MDFRDTIFLSVALCNADRRPQGIGDVSEDCEIQLGNRHHGRVAHYGDLEKNHIRKCFPAIFGLKLTKRDL